MTIRIMAAPHPLDQLLATEIDLARETVVKAWPGAVIQFRSIELKEPAKSLLKNYLAAEHADTLDDSTPRPPRLAKVEYDIIHADRNHDFVGSVIDINLKKEVSRRMFDSTCQAALSQ